MADFIIGSWVNLIDSNSKGMASPVGPAPWVAAWTETSGVITVSATNNNSGNYDGILEGKRVGWEFTTIANASLPTAEATALIGDSALLRLYRLEVQMYEFTATGGTSTTHMTGFGITDETRALGAGFQNNAPTPGERDQDMYTAITNSPNGTIADYTAILIYWQWPPDNPFSAGTDGGFCRAEWIISGGAYAGQLDPISPAIAWASSITDMELVSFQGFNSSNVNADSATFRARARFIQIRDVADYAVPFVSPA